jgi:hypothetical protein
VAIGSLLAEPRYEVVRDVIRSSDIDTGLANRATCCIGWDADAIGAGENGKGRRTNRAFFILAM